jgi:hypothetical protein
MEERERKRNKGPRTQSPGKQAAQTKGTTGTVYNKNS